MAKAKANYLDQSYTIQGEDAYRVIARMSGKLLRKLEKGKLTAREAIAIQLKIDDENIKDIYKKFPDIDKILKPATLKNRAAKKERPLQADTELTKTKATAVRKSAAIKAQSTLSS
jgi:hypothetical protein